LSKPSPSDGAPGLSIRRSFAWMGAAQAIAASLQFASSVVLAHYLSLHDAGLYAAAFAIVSFLSLVQALGLQALIVREESLTTDLLTTTFTVNALISVVLAVAIEGFSVGGSIFLRDAGVGRALSVLAVTPLFGIVSFLPAARLEREGRFKEIALAGSAGVVVGALTSTVLVTRGFSYMSMPYAQWLTVGVTALVLNLFGRHHVSFRMGFRAWRRVANFGLQMLAVSGVNSLTLRLSEILIGRFLGLSALGLFNRASGFNSMIWTNVHLLIGRVMLVDFAEIRRQGVPLRDRYMLTVEMVTALLWPVFGGMMVISGPFILNVFGVKWLPAAELLTIIAFASIIHVAITMTWEVFAVTGELRTQTRIEFIRSLVALAAFVIGSTVSVAAAASARVVDAIFAVLLYRPHLNRMTETNLSDFVPIYLRSGSLTLLACGPAGALMGIYRFRPDVPLPLLGMAVLLGVLLWVGALWTTRHPLGRELRIVLLKRPMSRA
jgi:O-antigen/teichoic acid export membrane protein